MAIRKFIPQSKLAVAIATQRLIFRRKGMISPVMLLRFRVRLRNPITPNYVDPQLGEAEIAQEMVAHQVAGEEASQISPILDFPGKIWLRT
jgi:hypothetical protein